MTNVLEVSKVNVYAVELEAQKLSASKVNAYAVELEEEKLSVTKVNAYGVELNVDGVYQDVSGNRPVYRDAPSGGIPYIDMSATGAALKYNVPEAGVYTLIQYNDDQTFTVSEQTMTAGENTLNITNDFNQLVGIKGSNIHRFTIDAIKEGMKARD